jgi:hypothetical protein
MSMNEMMAQTLVTAGLIYVGFSLVTFGVIFVLLKMADVPDDAASASIGDEARGASLCEFSEAEIARLVRYRDAVRAGYFTEQIEPAAVNVRLAAARQCGKGGR